MTRLHARTQTAALFALPADVRIRVQAPCLPCPGWARAAEAMTAPTRLPSPQTPHTRTSAMVVFTYEVLRADMEADERASHSGTK